jgi:hypothetical protein
VYNVVMLRTKPVVAGAVVADQPCRTIVLVRLLFPPFAARAMNQKEGIASPARTSTTRSDRGAVLRSSAPIAVASGATATTTAAETNDRGRGIIFYLHRPIGAPLETLRLSLEDDPAVMGRTSSKTKKATGATRGSYWAVPHPWKDFPIVWRQQQQQQQEQCDNPRNVEHLELSGNPRTWERLPEDEWAECCQIMSGSISVSLRWGLPTKAQSRQQLSTPQQRSQQRPIATPRRRTLVGSVRLLDNCPSPEQRQVLLRHLDPRRLEICTEGTGVRQTLEPTLARRHQHDDKKCDGDDNHNNIEELILHGPVLDAEDCRAVARLMTAYQVPVPSAVRTSGGGLRRLALRNVTFASREAWELLLEALRSSLSLECATWDHLLCHDGSEGQHGNGMPVDAPPQRLDRDDDDDYPSRVMKQLKDDLAQLHAFNALHRAACAAIRSHRPRRQSVQLDNEPRECRRSLDVVDSAIEVLRQWYLSSAPAAAASSSSSRSRPHPFSSPAAPPPRALPIIDPTSSTSAKARTLSSVVRRSRLLSSCS